MIKIILELNNTITRLAGNEYGQEIFENQVKDKIEYDKRNIIIFPDTIENIAISFVQGFSKHILENISSENIEKTIEIKGNQKVVSNFYKYTLY